MVSVVRCLSHEINRLIKIYVLFVDQWECVYSDTSPKSNYGWISCMDDKCYVVHGLGNDTSIWGAGSTYDFIIIIDLLYTVNGVLNNYSCTRIKITAPVF